MSIQEKTLAPFAKTLHAVKRLIFIVSIAVTCIFLINYLYSALNNLNHTSFFIIYSLFFAVALVTCFLDVLYYVKKKKKSKTAYRLLRLIKYGIRFAMIIINAYELANVHFSLISLIMIIISSTSLFFQTSLEIFGIIVDAIVRRIRKSFEKKANRKNKHARKNYETNDNNENYIDDEHIQYHTDKQA